MSHAQRHHEAPMRYRTVRITPNPLGAWSVTVADLDGDRDDQGTTPHPMGFYHYPARITDADAFAALKATMVRAHEQEIERLASSLARLRTINL